MKPRRERCLQCDRALPRREHVVTNGVTRTESFGYAGAGYFCSAVCGHAYAVAMLREVDGWDREREQVEREDQGEAHER